MTIADRQHGLVTRSDVVDAELSSWQWSARLEAGEWLEMAPGVWRHRATVVDWELRLRAGLKHLGDDAAVFGRAAAAWWGLDGATQEVVEFVVPRQRRERALPLQVHTTKAWDVGDLLVHRDLRVTSVTRTILDLAAIGVAPRLIEQAIDSGVRQRRTAVPRIIKRADDLAKRGRRGTALVLELLLDSGGESHLERRFLRLMREHDVRRPTCQVVHQHPSGGRVIRVDFQFPGTRLIVEVSGRLGHASDRDRTKDARRRNELIADGWDVREFTTLHVLEEPDYVVATVVAALTRADLVAS